MCYNTADTDHTRRRTTILMKRTTAFLMAALTLLLASCMAAEPAFSPDPSPIISEAPPLPTATPKSAEQLAAEREAELGQSIRDNMRLDVESLLPEGEEVDRFHIDLRNHSESLWILDIRDGVSAAIGAAVGQAESGFAGQGLRFVNQIAAPGWQYRYMLLQLAKGDAAVFSGYIQSSLSVEASTDSKTGEMKVTVGPIYYRDIILSVTGSDRIACLDAESAYDYMNTVFDENLGEKEYVLPPAEGNLTSGLTWPLRRFIRLRKTWYAARDGGARKHTGTDIWAREGTEIYSCTAGTVFYIGYWGGGGNTVVVTDDYGYMFYYHHMVRLTDFLQEGQRVEAGQLIGHVGNTGNSSRDHLHLTIVHPDGILVARRGAKPPRFLYARRYP